MSKPTQAMSDSKSTEELVYEAWEIVKHDSLASSRIGSPSQATREKLAAFFDQELAKRVVPTSGEMHEILMNYGKVCEEQGCLSPKAVTIRMDLATHFNDMEASLTN